MGSLKQFSQEEACSDLHFRKAMDKMAWGQAGSRRSSWEPGEVTPAWSVESRTEGRAAEWWMRW